MIDGGDLVEGVDVPAGTDVDDEEAGEAAFGEGAAARPRAAPARRFNSRSVAEPWRAPTIPASVPTTMAIPAL